MNNIKEFFIKYMGAIIGGIAAIVVLILNLHKVFIALLIIALGIILGNYIQYNKDLVKDKVKNWIDKL